MSVFEVTMQHTDETLELLSRMQYDLFCKSNLVTRSVLSLAVIAVGIVNYTAWWGILLVVYGCYLISSKYSSANHTAHKIAQQLKEAGLPFPQSRYVFLPYKMEVYTLPEDTLLGEPLPYLELSGLGEDYRYFYLFRDRFGGYMIPKEALGDRADDFRAFIEEHSTRRFRTKEAPIVRLLRRMFPG